MTDTQGVGEQQALPQTPLVVKMQYTKDLSFESPGAPQSLTSMRAAPDVNIDVSVDTEQLDSGDWEVVLHVSAEATSNDKQLFILELLYAGVFGVGPMVPQDQVRPLLLIECARILFPFARNIVAAATRDGGLPPLMLQPIDFVQLYQRKYGLPGAAGTAGSA